MIPEGNPSNARIERTALGNAVVDELYVMCRHYPAIRILQFCLMPDHLHAVIHVTQTMETSIRSVIRGYWQGVKKLGRAYTLAFAAELNSAITDEGGRRPAITDEGGKRPEAMDEGGRSPAITDEGGKRPEATDEGGYPFPVFTERPFIRPLSRRGQLQTMIRYVQMNPQRLATKRLKPGYFRVQKEIEIGGRKYDGVGNVALLMGGHFEPVHVRSVMVKEVLLQEQHPFVLLTDNGFRDYYKPADELFDACAAGRLLILSPWPYDEGKRHISRSECVALNAMAEEICKYLNE